MCIRDREDIDQVRWTDAEELAEVRRDTYPSLQRVINAWEAVSYTHLRAHETVLDLVCRLLLEKK